MTDDRRTTDATRERDGDANADTGPVGAVLGATLGPLGAAVGGVVDESRLAIGFSLGRADAAPDADLEEATTIEIEGGDEARDG